MDGLKDKLNFLEQTCERAAKEKWNRPNSRKFQKICDEILDPYNSIEQDNEKEEYKRQHPEIQQALEFKEKLRAICHTNRTLDCISKFEKSYPFKLEHVSRGVLKSHNNEKDAVKGILKEYDDMSDNEKQQFRTMLGKNEEGAYILDTVFEKLLNIYTKMLGHTKTLSKTDSECFSMIRRELGDQVTDSTEYARYQNIKAKHDSRDRYVEKLDERLYNKEGYEFWKKYYANIHRAIFGRRISLDELEENGLPSVDELLQVLYYMASGFAGAKKIFQNFKTGREIKPILRNIHEPVDEEALYMLTKLANYRISIYDLGHEGIKRIADEKNMQFGEPPKDMKDANVGFSKSRILEDADDELFFDEYTAKSQGISLEEYRIKLLKDLTDRASKRLEDPFYYVIMGGRREAENTEEAENAGIPTEEGEVSNEKVGSISLEELKAFERQITQSIADNEKEIGSLSTELEVLKQKGEIIERILIKIKEKEEGDKKKAELQKQISRLQSVLANLDGKNMEV